MTLEELAVTLTMLGFDKYDIKYDHIQLFTFKLIENPNLSVILRELLTQYDYQWEYLYYATQMKIFKNN